MALKRETFVPVTPGTSQVTLGGMVACDVHGKNHHQVGTFGAHVRSLRLHLPSGDDVVVSPEERSELFWATVGGCGLTGHISEVEFDLTSVPSSWLIQESRCARDWDQLVEGLLDSAREWPFTAAWADLLSSGRSMGRGVVFRARWADRDEARRTPVGSARPPRALPWYPRITRGRARAFNWAYLTAAKLRGGSKLVSPAQVFYPLDRIADWPRFYGPNGFAQYQCVLPRNAEVADRAREIIAALQSAGALCCLAVVKDCGPEGQGLLSFPREGLSLAIDFPIRTVDEAQRIHDAANEVLIGHGGRVYLAKDAFTRREHFEAMEPRLEHWRRVREEVDPERRIESQLGRRLLVEAP